MAIFCSNLLWIAASRVELVWHQLIQLGAPMMLFATLMQGIRIFYRQTEAPAWVSGRLYPLVQALVFLTFAWINMRVLNHLVMTTALPMRDELLAQGDVLLGFNWLAYLEFIHRYPALIITFDTLYASLTPLSVGAIVALVVMGQMQRAALFLESFFLVAVICVVVGMGFPAVGTFVHYGLDLADYPNFQIAPGTFWIDALAQLRLPDGAIRLSPLNLPGLAAFPSLHTAAAVVLAASFWRTRAGWPVAIYAGTIIAATPVFGGHYGVDLLAGGLVAVVVFAMVARHRQGRSFGFGWALKSKPATLAGRAP